MNSLLQILIYIHFSQYRVNKQSIRKLNEKYNLRKTITLRYRFLLPSSKTNLLRIMLIVDNQFQDPHKLIFYKKCFWLQLFLFLDKNRKTY